MKKLFLRNRRTLLLLSVLVMAFVVISANLSSPGRGASGFPDGLIARLVTPLQRGASAILGVVKLSYYNIMLHVMIKDKTQVQEEKISRLEGEVARLREKAAATDRLAELLAFKEEHTLDMRVARVIGFDSGHGRTITLDRGSAHGIGPNMPVVDARGVVGRVVKVLGTSCQVLLLVDFNSAIDAFVQRTRDRGIVVGVGRGSCVLKYVDRQSDVQVGDGVVTSGINALFPPGLVIGEVTAVQKEGSGLFQDIRVRPAVDVERLEEVFVVLRERP